MQITSAMTALGQKIPSSKHAQSFPSGNEATLFPPVPLSVRTVVADGLLKHAFSRPLGNSSGNSVSALVQAAFALLVGRMTNSDNICFGLQVQNKGIPVSGEVDDDVTIQNYIQQFETPAQYTNGSRAENDAQGYTPKYHALLVIHSLQSGATEVNLSHESDGCPLLIQIDHNNSNGIALAKYDSRVIDSWTVQKLLERLEFICHQLSEAIAGLVLKDISVFSPRDEEQIWSWNGKVPESIERCVHDLIKERVDAQPNAQAVDAWDGGLTYSELDQYASRLAGHLGRLGVRHDMLIPVCFEKSVWTSVAVLAVLKAGGSFVLLDSTLPEKRLRSISEQTGTDIILSSKNNLGLSSRLSKIVVPVNADSIGALEPSEEFQKQPPSTAMYTVFTSGSTGIPKGVVVSHESFCTALHYQLDFLQYTPKSRVFDFASYAFDISTYNHIATFVSGGCLCVPNETDRKENLGGVMADMKATSTGLTPTVARLLEPNMLPDLKTVMLLGEAVLGKDAEPWWEKSSVLNVYGPAECVLTTINYSATCPDEVSYIGRGVGLVLWIVDPEDHNRLMPPGWAGELLMEGPLVSRGYLNNPEQTAKVFIEDPEFLLKGTPHHPGRLGRLYKSGDLVRYNDTDGTLVFVGRKDTQVKMRGQRVELTEVEHHVQQCVPATQQAVAEVIIPKGENSDPVLAVFIQATQNGTDGAEPEEAGILTISPEIQQTLESRMPIYMVPSVFFSMRNFPITPTGKTDRKRLREIGGSFTVSELSSQTSQDGTKRQPTTDIQCEIQEIWAKVLGIPQSMVGMDDSFASLGGNSISAMRAAAMARASSIKMRIADVLQKKTIPQIAEGNDFPINENKSSTHRTQNGTDALSSEFRRICASLIEVQPEEIEDIFACSPTQQFLWKCQSEDPTNYHLGLGFDVSLNGDDVQLEVKRLEQAWRDVVKSHGLLRSKHIHTSLGEKTMRHVVILKNPEPGITHLQLGQEAEARDVRTKDTPTYKPGDLQHHLTICPIDDKKAFLKLEINVTILDGFTVDVFCQDLRSAYHGTLSPGGQYRELVAYLQAQPREPRLEWWSNYLSGSDPTMYPVSDPVTDCANSKGFDVPGIDSAKVREFCAIWQVMHPIVIHTAWSFVLRKHTGVRAPVFATFCMARDLPIPGAERTWGPFIGIIPYRTVFNKAQSVIETLRTAQLDYLTSLKHQHTTITEMEEMPKFKGKRFMNSMMSYQKAWGTNVCIDDPLSIVYSEEYDPTDFEVNVTPIETPEEFRIALTFRPGCINVKEAISLAADYGKAISLIINNPSLCFEDPEF